MLIYILAAFLLILSSKTEKHRLFFHKLNPFSFISSSNLVMYVMQERKR